MAAGPHWNIHGARSEIIIVPPATGPLSASSISTALYLVSSPLPKSPSAIRFDIVSHDQGWCDEPQEWSWTWFEVSILRPWQDNTDDADFNHTGLQYIRAHPEDFGGIIQEIGYYFEDIPNEHGNSQSHSPATVTSLPFIKNKVDRQWRHHSVSWEQQNNTGDGRYILSLLEEGDRLAIWARAQFPGWMNFIKEARISVTTLNPHEDQHGFRRNLNDLEAATTHAEMAMYKTHTDLESAISYAQEALTATPTNHPDRGKWLSDLSHCISDRYDRFGFIDDLHAAINYAQDAVTATPTNHPEQAKFFNELSIQFSKRYDRFGNTDDLDAAINYTQEAVTAARTDHHRVIYLSNMSAYLHSRYNQAGDINDLEAAIKYAQEVMTVTPTNHPDWLQWLSNLSVRFFSRYSRFGNTDDLEAAIKYIQKAIAATPTDHPDRVKWVNNLSSFLIKRYDRFGNTDDLEAAIKYIQKAIAVTPTDHPNRSQLLNNLSHQFSKRYRRFDNIDDLEAAIKYAQEAVTTILDGHPTQTIYLSNLSLYFSDRYSRFGNTDDLEAAIKYIQEAMAVIPTDHPDRSQRLSDLSIQFYKRYDRFGNTDDLEAAIKYAQEAVTATPPDHPDRAKWLNNLSCCLYRQHWHTGEAHALLASLKWASLAANLSNAPPSHRMVAARRAIRIHVTLSHWDDASELATSALQLLPLICGRSLTREDQQYAITHIAGLAADACSIFLCLNQPARALQSLEFGRGLILGYLIDSRSDPEQLQIDHPPLAKEYNRLRFILSRPLDSVKSAGMEQLIELKQKAPRELDQCLATIRNQPGYERFLLEPAVDELVAQATEGPLVVVNITDFGSHAVIILDRDIYSLDLPALSTTAHFDLHHMVQHFRAVGQRGPQSSRDLQSEIDALGPSFQTSGLYYDAESLSWLWEHCVEPILISIEDRIPDSTTLPRIWWIGTGVASSLPFHAAGIHGNSTQSAMDRSISSYTPTIKALAYSRSRLVSKEPHDDEISVAIVAMPTTPQEQPLPGVQQEIDAIYRADPSVYNIQVQMHPNSETVLQAIRETDIVHFACHSSCDPVNPSESHLLLQNGSPSLPLVDRLTVRQISDQVVSQAYIAFLSACSTARVTAERFTDESIHLASAFQVAGFGHVIASLWSVDDGICATIARSFYRYLAQNPSRLVSNRLVAEALHAAVLEIRMTERPGIWASFVHYGA